VSSQESVPNHHGGDLDAIPAPRWLFQRYHIGGCASSATNPATRCRRCATTISRPVGCVIACIRENEVVEATLHIRPPGGRRARGETPDTSRRARTRRMGGGHIEGTLPAVGSLRDPRLVPRTPLVSTPITATAVWTARPTPGVRPHQSEKHGRGLEAWVGAAGPARRSAGTGAGIPRARVAAADATGRRHFAVTIGARRSRQGARRAHRVVYRRSIRSWRDPCVTMKTVSRARIVRKSSFMATT